ncbi:MAG: hypothetical protein LBH58_02385 [Tannerellaceae bacterium]|nr:hypothetical protein [Tannerellaceae bacterium]
MKKVCKGDGSNPVLLYGGYGGFNVSMNPELTMEYKPSIVNCHVSLLSNEC